MNRKKFTSNFTGEFHMTLGVALCLGLAVFECQGSCGNCCRPWDPLDEIVWKYRQSTDPRNAVFCWMYIFNAAFANTDIDNREYVNHKEISLRNILKPINVFYRRIRWDARYTIHVHSWQDIWPAPTQRRMVGHIKVTVIIPRFPGTAWFGHLRCLKFLYL
jgi:hypothetical protein